MNYASAWFLVSVVTGHYLGPLPQDACRAAAVPAVTAAGITCKQASSTMACAVDGRPGTYTACPVFDFPHVTVKP